MKIDSVQEFYKAIHEFPHLCNGCGMCAGICPTDAVSMVKNKYNQYVPSFLEENCIFCDWCVESCPGINITGTNLNGIGEHKKIYLAWSNDLTARRAGSSGGVITALTSWMLSEGMIEKAIMLNSSQSPIEPQIDVIRSADSVLQCSGSKYISAPMCSKISEFTKGSLITTLPCQSSAIKKAGKDKGYVFGLFCSKANTSDLIRYICVQENIQPGEIQRINFRDGEWPGKVLIQTYNRDVRIPYNRSYFTAIFNGGYFNIQGCLLCPDYFNENADISFGDPWGMKIDRELLLGKTIVIVRTSKGLELIEKAISDHIISVEEIQEEQVINGHKGGIYNKKISIKIRLRKFQEYGLPIPEHNFDLSKKFNPVQTYLQNYYFKNNVLLKNKYEEIFSKNKWFIFFERFFNHAIHTIYIRFFLARSNPINEVRH